MISSRRIQQSEELFGSLLCQHPDGTEVLDKVLRGGLVPNTALIQTHLSTGATLIVLLLR
jgi:hypothetical protein